MHWNPAVDFLLDPVGAAASGAPACELWLVTQSGVEQWLAGRDAVERAWLQSAGFKAERQQLVVVPGADGLPRAAVLGLGPLASLAALELWHVAGLPDRLPGNSRWRAAQALEPAAATTLALGWAYGSYRFDAYKSAARSTAARARLQVPANADVRTRHAAGGRDGHGARFRQHAGVGLHAGAARRRSHAARARARCRRRWR